MDIQRLRNLTTEMLHTKMADIYEDLGIISGETNLMTHMLPRVLKACEPWLREKISDPRFWDGKYDTTHVGEFDLPVPSDEDQKVMLKRFMEQPTPW